MISIEEIKHIAQLARVGLKEKEAQKFQKEISEILNYFNQLKKADISKTDSDGYISMKNIVRSDEVKKKSPEEIKKLVEMMPETKDGYLKIKTIL